MSTRRQASAIIHEFLEKTLNYIARRKGIISDEGPALTFRELYLAVMKVADPSEKETIRTFQKTWKDEVKSELKKGRYIPIRVRPEIMIPDPAPVKNYRRIIMTSAFAVIVIILSLSVVFAVPHIREYRFYKQVLEEQTFAKCHDYYNTWPEGRHYEDVMMLETDLADNDLDIARKYLARFPDGRYLQAMEKIYNGYWDRTISRYKTINKDIEPEAEDIMLQMLEHMKKKRIHTIRLHTETDKKLEDMETIAKNVSTKRLKKGIREVLSTEMISLEDFYSDFNSPVIKLSYSIVDNGIFDNLKKFIGGWELRMEANIAYQDGKTWEFSETEKIKPTPLMALDSGESFRKEAQAAMSRLSESLAEAMGI